jgi:hypothetical protein
MSEEAIMATGTWLDGNDNWNTASDWSDGVPTTTSAVVVNQGQPEVTAPIDVASITISTQAGVEFTGAGDSTVSGSVTGPIFLDYLGGGGSSLKIGGLLDEDGGDAFIGNEFLSAADTVTAAALSNVEGAIEIIGAANPGSTPYQATLDVAGPASMGAGAGVITGSVGLEGDALLEFGSGQLTTIAADSNLELSGPGSFVADAGHLGSNSALKGLRTNDGTFSISGSEHVTTTGAFDNVGKLDVEGSDLQIGGALTNSGTLQIGGDFQTANAEVSAAALTNTADGDIELTGSIVPAVPLYQAVLDIAGQASLGVSAGVVDGSVGLSGDSLIEFGWGQITTIAADGSLGLAGPHAFVADAADPSGNSALTSLRTVNGAFSLGDGQLATNGSLDIGNDGTVDVYADTSGYAGNLDIGGALRNSGELQIFTGIGDPGYPTADATVTATSLRNFNGVIQLEGDPITPDSPYQALLDIAGQASLSASPGVLDGNITLLGNALIEFGSGQITTIAANSYLTMDGPDALITDAGATTSNSALRGLSANYGTVELHDGQIVIAGSFDNAGTFYIDAFSGTGPPGSSVTNIGGTLTNRGTLDIGIGQYDQGSTLVSADRLDNAEGTISVDGFPSSPTPTPVDLVINGAATNTGTIYASDGGAVTIDGALCGSGTVDLSYGALLSIGAGDGGTIVFQFTDISGIDFSSAAVDITSSRYLGDTVSGFGTGDTLDFEAAHYSASDLVAYAANGQNSGGLVTIDSLHGAPAASFEVTGSYTASDFALSNDGHGGILVGFAAKPV